MLRVLTLCEYTSLNGGERSFLEVASRLDRDGFEFTVAAPPNGPLHTAIQQTGLVHTPFSCHHRTGKRLTRDDLREKLQQLIKSIDPDLVHANSVSMSRLAGPVTRRMQVPSLGHLRDILKLSRAAIADLNDHDRLLAVSEATRTWFTAAGLEERKTFVEFNGVDLNRFRPRNPSGALHMELGLPATALLIGNAGQIGMRKGVDLYVEAARIVAARQRNAHFVVVGQRYSEKAEAVAFENHVRTAASKPPLDDRMHFLGVRNDMNRLLNEFTILVHAARQEPLGRVLLESAAAGVPVIATNVGGTREIFDGDQEAAVLVDPESADALATAISNLLVDSTRRTQLARAARRCAELKFDARNAARRLAAHYRELVR